MNQDYFIHLRRLGVHRVKPGAPGQCAGDKMQRLFFQLMNNALYGKTFENV